MVNRPTSQRRFTVVFKLAVYALIAASAAGRMLAGRAGGLAEPRLPERMRQPCFESVRLETTNP